MPVFERAENCEGPAVAALFSGGRCPCCAGRVGAAGAFCGCERPCDHTATSLCLFNSLVPQIQFTARVVDILLYNRDWYAAFIRGVMAAVNGGFLTHFASFFALLRLSGVERQFFELSSAHNCECSRAPAGAGVAGSLTPR